MEKPLFFGRLLRVLSGGATLGALPFLGDVGPWWTAGLVFLGASLLVGGLVANPGCEVTALPNLFFKTRAHWL